MIDKLLVIAGAGSYPRLLVEGARKAGCPAVEILAVRGSTASATCAAATAVWWTSIGSLAKGIRDCGLRGYDGVIMAGQINPLSLFRGRFEPEVVQWLKELPVKNAHLTVELRVGLGLTEEVGGRLVRIDGQVVVVDVQQRCVDVVEGVRRPLGVVLEPDFGLISRHKMT